MAAMISILILALLPIIKAAPQGVCDANYATLRTRGSCNVAPTSCKMFDSQPCSAYTPYSDISQMCSPPTQCDNMPPPGIIDPSTVVYTSLSGGLDYPAYDGGYPTGIITSISRQQSGCEGLRSRGSNSYSVSPQQYSMYDTQTFPSFSTYTDYRPQQTYSTIEQPPVIYTQDLSGPCDFTPPGSGGNGGGCVTGGGGGGMSGVVMPGPGYDISYTSSISPPSVNGCGGLRSGPGYGYGIPSTGLGLQTNVGLGLGSLCYQ